MQNQIKKGLLIVAWAFICLFSYMYLLTHSVLAVEPTSHQVLLENPAVEPSGPVDQLSYSQEKQAILQVRPNDAAFRLSAAAKQVLFIRSRAMQVSKQRAWVPLSSLVEYQQYLGIFVVQNQWYRLIPVRQVGRTGKGVWVSSTKLSKDQDVVVSGIPMLRIAYLDASGQSGRGETEE